MSKREYDGHTIENDPRRHIFQRISNNVSRRHAGCTFSCGEVRDVIESAEESTGVPQADDEIRQEAQEYGLTANGGTDEH
jgi:hypothetical protein